MAGQSTTKMIQQVYIPPRHDLVLNRWSGADLDDEQLRALAVGAWMANSNEAFHDTLPLLPCSDLEPPETPKEHYIDLLLKGWGVTGHDEAVSMVKGLHSGLHAPVYGAVHRLVLEAVRAGGETRGELQDRHTTFLEDLAGLHGLRENTYVDYYRSWTQALRMGVCADFPGDFPDDIYAWDLSRAVWVTRAAVTGEYLTEDEAWVLLAAGLEQARARYANWRQFGRAVVAGRYFWRSYEDLASAGEWGRDALGHVQLLALHPLSPWRRLELHPDVPALTLSPLHDFTGWV